jgi:microcystin-dependent protein
MATVTASYNWVSGETVTPTKLNTTAAPTVVVADGEVTVAKLAAAVQQLLVPAGAVQAFAMNSAPAGWLAADGAAVSRSTYAALFAAISTTYGAGDGSTTFALPDLRGYFVRGSGTNSDATAAGTFGAKIADTLKSHTHTGTTSVDGSHAHAYAAYFSIISKSTAPTPTNNVWDGLVNRATAAAGDHSHTFTTDATGSGETAPRNIAMLYCIKF